MRKSHSRLALVVSHLFCCSDCSLMRQQRRDKNSRESNNNSAAAPVSADALWLQGSDVIKSSYGKNWFERVICTIRWPHPPIWVVLKSFLRGGPKCCLRQSCSITDLDKAVTPWRRKRWKKRYSNTLKMQNQAKLAAGAHRGHKAKHLSKCLHWCATAMPAASCAQLPFGGAILHIEIWNFIHPQNFHHPPCIISASNPIPMKTIGQTSDGKRLISRKESEGLTTVPSMGSCSQFCLILHPHRVALPFPPTQFCDAMAEQICANPWETALNWKKIGITPPKWFQNDPNWGVGSSYGQINPSSEANCFPMKLQWKWLGGPRKEPDEE